MKLENRLKVWRAKRGITQDELAKAVGMSRQSINAIEKGRFVPSILTALKMSHYFETTIEELFISKRIRRSQWKTFAQILSLVLL